MQREFSSRNTCAECYVSTRAGTEKGVLEFLADGFVHVGRLLSGVRPRAAGRAERVDVESESRLPAAAD
jgi:hypothetical protein